MKLLLFMVLITVPFASEATRYDGYKKNKIAGELELKGFVNRFIETKTEYKIAIHRHAAFYSFPKQKNSAEFKKILNDSHAQKISYLWKINAYSREIVSMEPLKK